MSSHDRPAQLLLPALGVVATAARDTGARLSMSTRDPSVRPNLAIIVFTNLGSEAGLICKQPLRPVTTPQCCEALSPNPINKAFTYNGLHRFHTVDLSPQFRKENFDAVCAGRLHFVKQVGQHELQALLRGVRVEEPRGCRHAAQQGIAVLRRKAKSADLVPRADPQRRQRHHRLVE